MADFLWKEGVKNLNKTTCIALPDLLVACAGLWEFLFAISSNGNEVCAEDIS